MEKERTICCCGAVSWVRAIVWFEIVGNLLIIGQGASNILQHAGFTPAVISCVIYLLGLYMAIVLIKGTNERNIGRIRAWIIFKVVFVIILITIFIVQATALSSATTGTPDGFMVFGITVVIVGIVVNGFCIGVAYIYIKNIKAGVFK